MSRKRRPGASRVRRVQELQRGNTRALRHGVFAEVLNAPDVATEVALVYAGRPALDPIRDTRLVELLATTNVQRQRAIAAMQREGMSQQLTSYDARLAALVERLERAVHERERERIKERAVPHGQGVMSGGWWTGSDGERRWIEEPDWIPPRVEVVRPEAFALQDPLPEAESAGEPWRPGEYEPAPIVRFVEDVCGMTADDPAVGQAADRGTARSPR